MNEKKALLQLVGRFLAYTFLIAIIITTAVLANTLGPNPNLYSDDDWEDVTHITPPGYNSSEYNIVLDQHSHTTYSDGVLSVKQNAEWHIAMGFNAFFIIDHGTLENKDDIEEIKEDYADKGVIIMQGMEWGNSIIHMNILGLSKWDFEPSGKSEEDDIKEVIKEAHRLHALTVCNHIPWSENEMNMDNPSRGDLKDWGIDFIEVVNSDTMPQNVYDEESVEFCEDHGVGQITGSDMHKPDHLQSGGLRGWTFLDATNVTEDEIMEELRNKRTEISYSKTPYGDPGTHRENPQYTWIKPLSQFGGLFVPLWKGNGLDWVGTGLFLAFFYLIFAITEVFRVIKLKFWTKVEDRKSNIKPKMDEKQELHS